MNTVTIVDLLRHGETTCGQQFCGSTDAPLTDIGWTQMWTAAEKDAPRWDRIVTSPLTRCAAFAHALADRHQLPCTLDARLQEMHFGAWEGKTAAALMATDAAALARFWNDPQRHTPPRAETLEHFAARVLLAWHDMAVAVAGERILAITHGGVMRVLLCHVLQHPLERLLEFEVRHAQRLSIRIEHVRGQLHCTLDGSGV
jgi:alpha-ribazole phosphatase